MLKTLRIDAKTAAADELFILLHGVGGAADDLRPLAAAVAGARPGALALLPEAPEAFDRGPRGRQWFSIAGVDEANRPGRVRAALLPLLAYIDAAQRSHRIGPRRTTLIGFSQGGILALEAAATGAAGRVLALSSRFARLPGRWPSATRAHFIHGERDGVIAAAHSRAASERLRALGGETSLDLVPDLAHAVDARVAALALRRLGEPSPV